MTSNKPTHKALLKALEVVQAAVKALPVEALAEGTLEFLRLQNVLNQHYLYRSDVREVKKLATKESDK